MQINHTSSFQAEFHILNLFLLYDQLLFLLLLEESVILYSTLRSLRIYSRFINGK